MKSVIIVLMLGAAVVVDISAAPEPNVKEGGEEWKNWLQPLILKENERACTSEEETKCTPAMDLCDKACTEECGAWSNDWMTQVCWAYCVQESCQEMCCCYKSTSDECYSDVKPACEKYTCP